MLSFLYPSTSKAMEWETAAEVASAKNRPGYEKDGDRAAEVLAKHNIFAKVIYFERIGSVDAVTEDKGHADKFVVFVDVPNAGTARDVLAAEIKKGLRVVLSPERAR
jgi:hypothetical protein